MTNKVHNLTTNFALPLLGWMRPVYEPYLIDAYIRHDEVEHFTTGHIFVLLRWADTERYKKLNNILSAHTSNVSEYEPDNNGEYMMHVFKVSKGMLKDYNLFLEGKYSHMSARAKELIKASAKSGGVTSQILDRDPRLREVQEQKMGIRLSPDNEVWPCISDSHTIGKEIFTSTILSKL